MSYETLEVDLDHGLVRPRGAEKMPGRSRALLTLLDAEVPATALTCTELAARWPLLEKLSAEESTAFADDLEQARRNLPPLRAAWD